MRDWAGEVGMILVQRVADPNGKSRVILSSPKNLNEYKADFNCEKYYAE